MILKGPSSPLHQTRLQREISTLPCPICLFSLGMFALNLEVPSKSYAKVTLLALSIRKLVLSSQSFCLEFRRTFDLRSMQLFVLDSVNR
jgi:hypothetical protein